ncbi:hypothetical protein MESS2_1230002 [Mesorhizobium metallidurans STM 2683]|uniref:Uncharacterized protein n=1 Tax=Mesorhizobium metallidurans STM 2683 TaxID=1297569 RepID=M5EX40_9HYPH|nr:hypothetical protein MESS2_1230002 [Mesorhizobium metallidurans STM 2683]
MFRCETGGQTVETRYLSHVIHHEQRGHKPLMNDGCQGEYMPGKHSAA